MKLANQEQVQALDPTFGRMAVEVGVHAWSLPQLTMREKAFVFLAADMCTANVGFALVTHVQMAAANGVSPGECVAAIRHLAPYVGYPTAAVALQQLQQGGLTGEPHPVAAEPQKLSDDIRQSLVELDARLRPILLQTSSLSVGWTTTNCHRGSGPCVAWPLMCSTRRSTNPLRCMSIWRPRPARAAKRSTRCCC